LDGEEATIPLLSMLSKQWVAVVIHSLAMAVANELGVSEGG
jgi:hypothetical protein